MQLLCHLGLGLLVCQFALLAKPSARFEPFQLNRTEGETATFICNISNVDFQYNLNWYKLGHDNQPVKLESSHEKYNITELDPNMFKMEIRDLKKNDSGIYYCWLNAFSWPENFLESNRSQLIVTAAVTRSPEEESPPGKERKEDDANEKGSNPSLATVIGAGLLSLLVCLYFLLLHARRRREEQKKLKDENPPLKEEDPSPVSVFTVDYEMLDFHVGGKASHAPPKSFQWEPTEYATIVFPVKNPAAEEPGGSVQKSCPHGL